MYSHVPENLENVENSVAKAAENAGRDPKSVKLLPVSKTFPPEAIQMVYNCDKKSFGENKVQELLDKAQELPRDIEWHLIGHLQRNKVGKVLEVATYIHSVDSYKLLKRINRLAEEKNIKPKILLQVNVSGEETKYGLSRDELKNCAEYAAASQFVDFKGLMTMAPFGAEEEELRSVFSTLREDKNRLEKDLNISLPELSMGMSADYKIAIEEGATIVRIGSKIFGKRY